MRDSTAALIVAALESAGVALIPENGGGAEVWLRDGAKGSDSDEVVPPK